MIDRRGPNEILSKTEKIDNTREYKEIINNPINEIGQ